MAEETRVTAEQAPVDPAEAELAKIRQSMSGNEPELSPQLKKFQAFFNVFVAVQMRSPIVMVAVKGIEKPWAKTPGGISAQNEPAMDDSGIIATDILHNVQLMPDPTFTKLNILQFRPDAMAVISVEPADVLAVTQLLPSQVGDQPLDPSAEPRKRIIT